MITSNDFWVLNSDFRGQLWKFLSSDLRIKTTKVNEMWAEREKLNKCRILTPRFRTVIVSSRRAFQLGNGILSSWRRRIKLFMKKESLVMVLVLEIHYWIEQDDKILKWVECLLPKGNKIVLLIVKCQCSILEMNCMCNSV